MADLFQYTYLEQYWLQTFILKCIALWNPEVPQLLIHSPESGEVDIDRPLQSIPGISHYPSFSCPLNSATAMD